MSPIPIIAGGLSVLGKIRSITSAIGIKSSFKSKADFSSKEWFEFHSSVRSLKTENGAGISLSDEEIGGVFRYLKSDYPIPDRDKHDTQNRTKWESDLSLIERLSGLAINNASMGENESMTNISSLDQLATKGAGCLIPVLMLVFLVGGLIIFLTFPVGLWAH